MRSLPPSLFSSALILTLAYGCQPRTSAVDRLGASVDSEGLRADIAALSADDMEGRAPGTPGGEKARAYLAQRLEEIGLEPAGLDGGWEQPLDIVGVTANVPETWAFQVGSGDLSFDHWEDFIAASGVQADQAKIENAELVFVGYGIQAPEYDWDDFKGQDTSGKVLVMLNNDPDWSDDLFAGPTRLFYGRWVYKYMSAARQGAAGAIIIHTTPSAGYPWQVVQSSWTGEQVELPAEGEPRSQIEAWLTEDAARRLFAASSHDYDQLVEASKSRDFEPVELGVSTSLTLDNQISRKSTANVLARLPGTDSELSEQYVVYSAHFDHLGNGGSDTADPIYNGALDNAVGVAQVLAIAEAMSQAPTKRSALFAFVAAEESGLLGSAYFARHPTVPPGLMAANINYDGGNIWGRTNDVTYIGFGKSSLDQIVTEGAATQDRIVKPDQFPDRGFFYRSDQFNFAKIGVPAIYLDTGTDFVDRPEEWGREQIEAWEANHYHQVSDELLDEWNYEGMIEDVHLGIYCGTKIGNGTELPTWNAGDEFEAARLEALEDVGQ